MLKLVALIYITLGVLAAQVPRRLTKDQIEQLIKVLPDKALAREIQQRGLNFRLDKPTVSHFKDNGAGTETLKVLTETLPSAELLVFTAPPSSDVSIDGGVVGRTDDTGKLVVSELNEGVSEVRISKDGYRAGTYDVTLARNKTAELRAILGRVTGFLSISTDPPDTAIVVDASNPNHSLDDVPACNGPMHGNVRECVPGEYTVRASRQGFLQVDKTVSIFDGQTTTVSLTLVWEPSIPDLAPAARDGVVPWAETNS